ncbi:nickel-dependent lactate racemase [Thermoanaerobacterium sp. RBIITD]|uniref:nickel-dependent lactate racemase n=1 Tax=Thermoanaerobacterium sp. RBIITD TaxID=1550240 RepID=UPI000BB7DAF1|nr:nickel-dependent lactate racemase [Thermoanaerobacterium sp. RBIITD]SNX53427.1 Nickel-dependent lactate racemase [Thermoanaerobacterium sp. RBIITD]
MKDDKYKDVLLKYGKETVSVKLDKEMCNVLYPEDLPGVYDPQKEVIDSIENPIGSPSLKDMAKGKRDVVILASDITRPSPSNIMVPPIVDELNKAGIPDESIKVVFGLGYHRKQTEEEKKKLVGEDILKRVRCIDHDINDCVYVGTTKRGTPVEVFREVYDADFVIATGNLELHYKAGYSGGYKALLPGVCSKNTIEKNHILMFSNGAMPGKIDGNPMREDIEEGGKLAGVDFIVNAVLNSHKEIVKVVAGDPVRAHREGAKYIDKMYKRVISEKADIVIASCGGYPKDINLYQAQKGLDNAAYSVKDGGTIILVAECIEGLGEKLFSDWMVNASCPDEPLKWIKEEFRLGAHKAAVICEVLKRAEIYLVSSLDRDFTEKIFFKYAKTVQDALDEALKKHEDGAKILVIPYANSTLPYVE